MTSLVLNNRAQVETWNGYAHIISFAFFQLMTSTAVHRWNTEIQEGINNMLQLLMDLVAARLKHQPVPQSLMDVLTLVRCCLGW